MKRKILFFIVFAISCLNMYSKAQQKQSLQKTYTYYVKFVNFSQELLDYMDGNLFDRPVEFTIMGDKYPMMFKPFHLIENEKNLKNETHKILVTLKKEKLKTRFSIEIFTMDTGKWRRIRNMGYFDVKPGKEYIGKQIADHITRSPLK